MTLILLGIGLVLAIVAWFALETWQKVRVEREKVLLLLLRDVGPRTEARLCWDLVTFCEVRKRKAFPVPPVLARLSRKEYVRPVRRRIGGRLVDAWRLTRKKETLAAIDRLLSSPASS